MNTLSIHSTDKLFAIRNCFSSLPHEHKLYSCMRGCYTHILRDSVIIISSPMLRWLLWEETSVQVSHTKKTRQATKCDRHAKIQIFSSWIPIDKRGTTLYNQPFLAGFSRNEILCRVQNGTKSFLSIFRQRMCWQKINN